MNEPVSPPPIVRRPLAVKKRFASARRATSVLVSRGLVDIQGVSQSQARKRASRTEGTAPKAGEMAAREREISMTWTNVIQLQPKNKMGRIDARGKRCNSGHRDTMDINALGS